MLLPKRTDKTSWIVPVIWVLVALVCVQGYLHLRSSRAREQVVTGAGNKEPVAVRKVPPVVKKTSVVPSRRDTGREPAPIVQSPASSLDVSVGKTGVIAVVTDDWGYNRTHCQDLADMPGPVAVAILPGLNYSRDIIACAKAAGHEPILHLPFEPHGAKEMYDRPGYILTVDMSPELVRSTTARILKEMDGVVGVNNHTGSRGTEDPVLVEAALTEIRKKRLFFLDSVTTAKTVCGQVADRLKMRIARRDVFLDNRNERGAIESEFANAVRIARSRGHALAIGHDRALTLQVIHDQMLKYKAQGIKFVTVAEYIRRYEYSGN